MKCHCNRNATGLLLGVLIGVAAGASSVYRDNVTASVAINPNYAITADPVNQAIDLEDKVHNSGDHVKAQPRIQDRLKDQGSYYWRNAKTSDDVPKHCYNLSHARLAKCVVEYRENELKYQRTPAIKH